MAPEPDFDYVTDWLERLEAAGLELKDTTADIESLTEMSKVHGKPTLGWIKRHTIRPS